jgi:hypothetical protein
MEPVMPQLLDKLFAAGQPSKAFLATSSGRQLEAPTPSPVVLSLTAREAEAVFATRQPVVNTNLFHLANVVQGTEGWLTNPLADSLIDQLVRAQVD